MEKNFAVIAGVVVLVALVLGGIFWYTQGNPSQTATSTVQTVVESPGQGQEPGMPVVTTDSNLYAYDTSAALSGRVNPDGPFTTYWFEYGTTQNLGSKSPVQTVGSGYQTITTPQYISGLTTSTTYYYRLVAQNSFGTQAGATYSFVTSPTSPAPVGSIPATKTLAATGVSRTAATLSGQVTANKAPTQFWFEYGTTQNLGAASALQSVGSGTTAVAASLALSSLSPATTYYFRLDAQNQFGISNGAVVSFKTAGPPATTTSAAPVVTTQVPSSVATTSAILRGTVNSNSLTTTYWFEYSANAGFGSGTKTTPHSTLAAAALTLSAETTITGLSANTTYYYRTVAQSSAGTSRGDTQSFKTK